MSEASSGDRIIVAVSASPLSQEVVRRAHRVAQRLDMPWTAVAVETAELSQSPDGVRAQLADNLRVAAALGAQTVAVPGERVAPTLANYAHEQRAIMIVVGKPAHPRWRDRVRGSLVEDIVRESGSVEVLVVAGEHARSLPRTSSMLRAPSVGELVFALLVTAALTILGHFLDPWVTESDQVMLLLLGVVLVAYRTTLPTVLGAAVLSVAVFDFFFVPPRFTFAIESTRYLLTFFVMGLLAVVVSILVWRVRAQAASARAQHYINAQLFELSRRLTATNHLDETVEIALHQLHTAFGVPVTLFVKDDDWRLAGQRGNAAALDLKHLTQLEHTPSEPSDGVLLLPLTAGATTIGAVALHADEQLELPKQRYLLDTMCAQIAEAMGRIRGSDDARRAHVDLETERLRNSLLATLSHDLRTPVASIRGATEVLLEARSLDPEQQRTLLEGAHEEATRLGRLLENTLEMTRIEGGGLQLHPEWLVPEETVGAVLRRVEAATAEFVMETQIDVDLGFYDEAAIETALTNLVENAARYSEPNTTITVRVSSQATELVFEVLDQGIGFEPGEEATLFTKFVRGARAQHVTGTGIGLAIVAAVVAAHHGSTFAELRTSRGAQFGFRLPQPDDLPTLEG